MNAIPFIGWIFAISIVFNKLLPIFNFHRDISVQKKEIAYEQSQRSKERMGDFYKARDEFMTYVNKLYSGEIDTKEELLDTMRVIDVFLDEMCEICEAMNNGIIANSNIYVVTARQMLGYKYTRNDNLIIRALKQIDKIHKDIVGYSMINEIRMSDYEPIFQTYLKNLPLWQRFLGFMSFYKWRWILEINK